MSIDFSLLYLLLNNISIFVVMVVGYSYLVDYLQSEPWLFRQLMLGALFGAIVFVSMHVQIPAAEGVFVDQRNAIIVLAGAYGGPVCGAVAMIVAALYRISLGGTGTFAGIIGVTLSLGVGSALYHFGWHRRGPLHLLVASAVAVALTSPGFLFVGDLQNGWALLKRMAAPWGTGLFVGIFLGGMLLTREDRRLFAEREKKYSEDQFRALFHSSEVSIWNQDFSRVHARLQQLRDQGVSDLRDHIARNPGVVDELAALSRVTLVNQAALRLYGVSSEEAFKANQAAMIGGGRPSVIADLLHAMWEGKSSFRAEDTHVTRSGRELTVVMSMPIPTSADDFHSIPVSVFDITDRVQAERARNEALQQANRANQAKSDFLAAMSHELRTPLNAILGFSELLATEAMGPLGSKRYCDYARHIHTSGGMLLELVDDLLDVSTIEAGRRDLTIAPVAMEELAREAVSMVAPLAADKSIDVTVDLPDHPPVLHVDRRAIQQVLINLLSNSVKYTASGGTVTVTTTTGRQRKIDINVSDTGPGIAPDRLEDVINPFVRGEKDPHKAQGGWGLGLSIARSLVEMHDGDLIIDSVVGEGTTVTVRLPYGVPGPAGDTVSLPGSTTPQSGRLR